jgi:uncharacterized protein (TIGR00251 family)
MILRIKVKPNSKKDEITRDEDGTIIVRIKAPPVDGKANDYLIAFLSAYFDLPKSRLVLLKGQTNQFKTIEIDASEEVIHARLQEG